MVAAPAPPDQPAEEVRNLTWTWEGPQPVATIFGDVRLTREEFGVYLIDRFGEKALEVFVNKRIIETACARKGVTVGAAEVEAAFRADAAAVGVSEADFVNVVLKQYGKSLFEWKEDVLKPRLLLAKLGRGRVAVTEDDLRKAFDRLYGPKVRCRLILWPKHREADARAAYEGILADDTLFDRTARKQAAPRLAASGGEIKPITRGNDPDDSVLEDAAFRLKPGEVSRPVKLPDGQTALLKCVAVIPAATDRDFDTEKARLFKEVIDEKVQREFPKLFAELKAEAKPQLHLKK